MKRRLREGAKLIVIDPRAHRPGDARRMSRPTYHLPLKPGTNVA